MAPKAEDTDLEEMLVVLAGKNCILTRHKASFRHHITFTFRKCQHSGRHDHQLCFGPLPHARRKLCRSESGIVADAKVRQAAVEQLIYRWVGNERMEEKYYTIGEVSPN